MNTVTVRWLTPETTEERADSIPKSLRKWFKSPIISCAQCLNGPPDATAFLVLPGGDPYCYACMAKSLEGTKLEDEQAEKDCLHESVLPSGIGPAHCKKCGKET